MTGTTVSRRKSRSSIRTMLMLWCFLFSIVPLCFVTAYSLYRYEEAVDNELLQRLHGNTREFTSLIAEYQKYLDTRMDRYQDDNVLGYTIAAGQLGQARAQLAQSLKNTYVSELSLFDSEGHLLTTLHPNGAHEDAATLDSDISLSDVSLADLKKQRTVGMVEGAPKGSMNLIMITHIPTKNERNAGYVQEIVTLGPSFLENLKKRMGVEAILFDSKGSIVAGSHPDFLLHAKDQFASIIAKDSSKADSFFDLPIRDESYGFMISPISWGQSKFYVGLGASKRATDQIKKQINTAFLSVIGTVMFLLIIAIWIAVRVAVRPLNDLINAVETMDQRDEFVEIPVKSDNEIGLLTESFNHMARRTLAARQDLQNKMKETEAAYQELKETQARLLHSAKMASLGQLVAGVAHELNNPIGFIYSNMSHLKDYSTKLMSIIDAAGETAPVQKAKEEADYTYIVEDLPRLIHSCEDGARRTRDIVLGLRNFSRLEEAKVKRVNVQEGIENTLKLISGELKGRVTVHTEFDPLPEILCYPSELNQVFMNILSNAAQAIDGNGEIWIATSQPPGSGQIQISIRDSGKGIPADSVDKIFDPFFTTKTLGQGTGLGLSISYSIVQKHGGDIQVSSQVGKGTEFTIVLPIEGPTANVQATVRSGKGKAGSV